MMSYKFWYKGICFEVPESWMKKHPGGDKVFKIFQNRDATDVVLAAHSLEAQDLVKRMVASSRCKENKYLYNGNEGRDIDISLSGSEVIQRNRNVMNNFEDTDYMKLVKIAREEELFKPSILMELIKAFYSFGFALLGAYLCITSVYKWLGSFLIAFGWYQLGWLGHDWSHHNCLPVSNSFYCRVNDWMAFMTCIARGTTLLAWKLRHNTHHMATNEVGNDPDIKLTPVLHFFEDFKAEHDVRQYQAWYYLPFISLLHIYWHVESYITCLKHMNGKNLANRMWARYDIISLILHLLWVSVVMYYGNCVLPIIFAYYMSGFMTAIVVFASHYGEERLHGMQTSQDGKNVKFLGLLEQTSKTVRNISGFFGGWLDEEIVFHLTGGLNVQFEHHLFPTMPRHNLRKMTPHIKRMCKEKGYPFHESNLYDCTKICVQMLSDNVKRNLKRLSYLRMIKKYDDKNNGISCKRMPAL